MVRSAGYLSFSQRRPFGADGYMGHFNGRLLAIGILIAVGGEMAAPVAVKAAKCGTNDTLTVAQMNWFSGGVMAFVTQKVLEKGYGCKVQLQPADTVPTASTMLTRGRPDIAPEMWISLIPDVWERIEKSGKYFVASQLYEDGGVLGWWIPNYVSKEHPELKSISDLKDNWRLFAEPGQPNKGRIYNGPPGWGGSVVTANLFQALGLSKTFELFSAGSGANLQAAIARKVAQKEAIVTFYWEPTAVISRYNLVRLQTPPYDAQKYACLSEPDCADPQVTGWQTTKIDVAVATPLKKSAPAVVEFLSKMRIPNDAMNKVLAWGDANSASLQDTADYFLENYPNVWTQWVPAEAAEAIKASLK